MFSLFLIAFVICVIVNHIRNGDSFIVFSRIVSAANSIREKTPRNARRKKTTMSVEYMHGQRIYCIMFPIRTQIKWTAVRVFKNGRWEDKTSKIEHFAGPFKNFHSMPITPADISPKYQIMAFKFPDGSIIHVKSNEGILKTFKEKHIGNSRAT